MTPPPDDLPTTDLPPPTPEHVFREYAPRFREFMPKFKDEFRFEFKKKGDKEDDDKPEKSEK